MTDDEAWEGILSIKYEIHEKHGQSYLSVDDSNKFQEYVSILRRNGNTSSHHISLLNSLIKKGNKNRIWLNEYIINQPRRDAQAFIGKKSVRELVFKLHGKACLCCGSVDNISLDHIVPIYHKGDNNIDNLQPLCSPCNSRKGTNIIDYRTNKTK